MSLYQETTIKLKNLPDDILTEVNNYVDYLLSKNKQIPNKEVSSFSGQLTETGMNDYLNNLEEYEELLSKGKIKW